MRWFCEYPKSICFEAVLTCTHTLNFIAKLRKKYVHVYSQNSKVRYEGSNPHGQVYLIFTIIELFGLLPLLINKNFLHFLIILDQTKPIEIFDIEIDNKKFNSCI